jgi:hypothetical protein
MLGILNPLIRKTLRALGFEVIPTTAALPREVRGDYEAILDSMDRYSFKFLDVKTCLPVVIKRAHGLGLHRSPPLDILDIGTGVGFFPVVCKHYGHRVVAIDRDGNQVFEDVTKWLAVDRRSWEITPFQPLPGLGLKFDLVTAFMVNFDRVDGADDAPWGVPEWTFFLRDLGANHLVEGGRVALLLNAHTMQVGEVMAYFASVGADIRGGWVVFRSLAALREPG